MIIHKNNLKVTRSRLGLTQAQVADSAEISERHYQHLEYGLSSPNNKTAQRLAKALGTTTEELFPLQEETVPTSK